MKYKPVILFAAAFALAACDKKTAVGNLPVDPQTQASPAPSVKGTAAAQVGVSSGSQVGGVLNAPGNYMRGMVGTIDKTKKALAASTKAEEERLDSDPTQEKGN